MIFSGYLVSIVGVIVLLTLVELILPNSKISTSVRSILGIFLLFCMVSPIIKLIGVDIDFKNLFGNYQLDENFLHQTMAQENDFLQSCLQSSLSQNFEGAKLSVQFDSNHAPSYVFVDLSDFVIKNKEEHINYYTAIKEFLKKQIDISDERIVVYG